ncbi:hypothetical protein [Cytobacillus firmus]|uniref:hypothetical protein n=1 Tax=Cytobacillus firmus TaxID=1399 RepID=UPI0034A18AC7
MIILKRLFSQGLLLICILFTDLIGAEGARSSKMLTHFLRAVFLGEAYSTSSGSSGTGENPQTQSVEEAHRLPRGSLSSLERKSTDNIEGLKTAIYTKRAF